MVKREDSVTMPTLNNGDIKELRFHGETEVRMKQCNSWVAVGNKHLVDPLVLPWQHVPNKLLMKTC